MPTEPGAGEDSKIHFDGQEIYPSQQCVLSTPTHSRPTWKLPGFTRMQSRLKSSCALPSPARSGAIRFVRNRPKAGELCATPSYARTTKRLRIGSILGVWQARTKGWPYLPLLGQSTTVPLTDRVSAHEQHGRPKDGWTSGMPNAPSDVINLRVVCAKKQTDAHAMVIERLRSDGIGTCAP